MKIENLRSEKKADRARVTATVTWEDCDRPAQEIYFETLNEYANDISPNPHAFLIATVTAATYFGETRVLLDAEICPELLENLCTAAKWIMHWFYPKNKKAVKIESKLMRHRLTSKKSERAGFLFSGGVDSLATLRYNHINYPTDHPAYIKDGILVYGLEVQELSSYEYVLMSMETVAQSAGINLIPVYTNLVELGPIDQKEFWEIFWLNDFMGATFASIAHAFANRFSIFSINSCHDIPNVMPYSSHPLVNPNYSSNDLRIKHVGTIFSRYEKVKLISNWDDALKYLRVCNRSNMYKPNVLNCGRCEKCIRTMLAFVATGALHKSTAFPSSDVTPGQISKFVNIHSNTLPLYGELLDPLEKVGRRDLVRAIEHRIAVYLDREPGFKAWAKRLDRDYFHGSLVGFRKKIHNLSVRS